MVSRQAGRCKIPRDVATSDTRAAFLKAAKRLFAERGFYGVSIAAVADELGLTKQALIHHFGTKERLYGEVLADMAGGLTGVVKKAREAGPEPTEQLEALFLRLYENLTVKAPDDTLLLVRELLDNRFRAEHAHSWPMKAFLDSLVAMVRAAPATHALSETEALARVYMLIGAMQYVAVSEPTLRNMYGKAAYADLRAQLPGQVRRLVRGALGGP